MRVPWEVGFLRGRSEAEGLFELEECRDGDAKGEYRGCSECAMGDKTTNLGSVK